MRVGATTQLGKWCIFSTATWALGLQGALAQQIPAQWAKTGLAAPHFPSPKHPQAPLQRLERLLN